MKHWHAEIAVVNQIAAVPTILDVICAMTGMGFAVIARVTEERWVACAVRDDIAFGLEAGGELEVKTTICSEIRDTGEAVVISNIAEDGRYRDHPTAIRYGFQSYISVPIVLPSGQFFGTLCAIDPRPRRLERPEVIGMFRMFAGIIAFQFSAIEQIASSEATLIDEQKTSDLREQFIAVLGHDLRNPLAAISLGAEMLDRTPLNEKASRMVKIIRDSATRMSGLIDDVMDFARGRLGDGLTLDRVGNEPLAPLLRHVVAELQAVYPSRTIVSEIDVDRTLTCDPSRIAQLLSNLLGNALVYGAPSQPVRVSAATNDTGFELSVANAGDAIPPAVLNRMFQPFARGAVQPNKQGLGLGLFIASEIARAHGGTLRVVSTAEETRFTFQMPPEPAAV